MRSGLELAAAFAAGILIIYAVAEAATAVAPYGDSPRLFYAVLADIGLGLGTLLLAVAIRHRRSRPTLLSARAEWAIHLLSAIALAVTLVISAANSLEASASGQGGPPLILEIFTGACRTVSLALVMARRVTLGFLVSGSLALALTVTALIAAR